ncbi:hypothetical protein ILYODFUR_036824 [Ilyodon furcidens]|uniref:Uncharacterized protein n=1 Tax=Ilyodon furcidens TaxID=33524 RepID=A0ABV0VAY8_9TELE
MTELLHTNVFLSAAKSVSSGTLSFKKLKKTKCQSLRTQPVSVHLLFILFVLRIKTGRQKEKECLHRRVNNLRCSGRLKLVSIDTCYLSADCSEDLIKWKDADAVEPNESEQSNNFQLSWSNPCVVLLLR